MGKYIITAGQNLYDVALHIYGSIEGITDLLVNNPTLSMSDRLQMGQELIYTDDFLINAQTEAYYRQKGITPANGERNVYFKESQHPRLAEFRLPDKATSAGVVLSGSGVLEIDWGDNTPLQAIVLGRESTRITHFFDNVVATDRIIRLYGDFRLRHADLTALTPSAVFLLNPIYTEEMRLSGSNVSLDFLPLFQGLLTLDLSKVKTECLLPLVPCRGLMKLDLSDVDVPWGAVDELLIALVREHYGRRNCEIILTEYPSGKYCEPQRDTALNYIINTGMEAVWLLTNEPSWNEGGPWVVRIGDDRYEYVAPEQQSTPSFDRPIDRDTI